MPILRKYTDSRAVNSLSDSEEVFFVRVLQHADDFGILDADPLMLRSTLFPLKPNKRVTDVSRQLAACERAGLIRCYVDGSGRQLLQVAKWKDAKKFKRSMYPPPEGQRHPLLSEKKPRPKNEVEVEGEVEEKGKLNGNNPPVFKKRERGDNRQLWQLLKDERAITDRIIHESNRTKPDSELINALKTQRQSLRNEMTHRTT